LTARGEQGRVYRKKKGKTLNSFFSLLPLASSSFWGRNDNNLKKGWKKGRSALTVAFMVFRKEGEKK